MAAGASEESGLLPQLVNRFLELWKPEHWQVFNFSRVARPRMVSGRGQLPIHHALEGDQLLKSGFSQTTNGKKTCWTALPTNLKWCLWTQRWVSSTTDQAQFQVTWPSLQPFAPVLPNLKYHLRISSTTCESQVPPKNQKDQRQWVKYLWQISSTMLQVSRTSTMLKSQVLCTSLECHAQVSSTVFQSPVPLTNLKYHLWISSTTKISEEGQETMSQVLLRNLKYYPRVSTSRSTTHKFQSNTMHKSQLTFPSPKYYTPVLSTTHKSQAPPLNLKYRLKTMYRSGVPCTIVNERLLTNVKDHKQVSNLSTMHQP